MKPRLMCLVLALMATSSAAAGAESLRDSLLADAKGQPVLLALDARGQLVARTLDGAMTRVLVKSGSASAAHDVERDLVWLLSDQKLDVLDLRAATTSEPAVTTIVAIRDKALEDMMHLSEAPTWKDKALVMMVDVGPAPTHKGAGIVLDLTKDGDAKPGLRVVGKTWLARELTRAKRPWSVPGFWHKRGGKDLTIPRGVGNCATIDRDETTCGSREKFGAIEVDLVTTSFFPMEGGECKLFDPKSKKFSLAPRPAVPKGPNPEIPQRHVTCGTYFFHAPAGKLFFFDDKACGPDLKCRSVGRLAVGWLDGDVKVGR